MMSLCFIHAIPSVVRALLTTSVFIGWASIHPSRLNLYFTSWGNPSPKPQVV